MPSSFCETGYQNAISEHNLDRILASCAADPQDAYRECTDLLRKDPGLTALVTPNEAGLSGVYQAVQDAGKTIPRDFSIIFFGISPSGGDVYPLAYHNGFPDCTHGQDRGRKLNQFA